MGSTSLEVRCIYDGRHGVDTHLVDGGLLTTKRNDPNSCPDGMDIWVPRSQAILNRAASFYGTAAWRVGVHSSADQPECCAGVTASSEEADADVSLWTSVGVPASPWFVRREGATVMPSAASGAYQAGCWLQPTGLGSDGLTVDAGGCAGFDTCTLPALDPRTTSGLLPSALTLHLAPCTLYPAPYPLHRAPSGFLPSALTYPAALLTTACIMYPVPCTLYLVPCTLYPVPCTLQLCSPGGPRVETRHRRLVLHQRVGPSAPPRLASNPRPTSQPALGASAFNAAAIATNSTSLTYLAAGAISAARPRQPLCRSPHAPSQRRWRARHVDPDSISRDALAASRCAQLRRPRVGASAPPSRPCTAHAACMLRHARGVRGHHPVGQLHVLDRHPPERRRTEQDASASRPPEARRKVPDTDHLGDGRPTRSAI